MSWPTNPRPAKSLVVLRDQINALSPNRDKSSDGMLASSAHTQVNPSSDHEPRIGDGGVGVVCALDITNDPAHGVNSESIAEQIRTSGDTRLKYVISNKKIAAPDIQGGAWRPYGGKNPHSHHCHISVKPEKVKYDDMSPWKITLSSEAPYVSVAPPPTLRLGSKGSDVVKLQVLLNKRGMALKEDGDYGEKTKTAVETFQRSRGLVVDGIAGPHTFDALKS